MKTSLKKFLMMVKTSLKKLSSDKSQRSWNSLGSDKEWWLVTFRLWRCLQFILGAGCSLRGVDILQLVIFLHVLHFVSRYWFFTVHPWSWLFSQRGWPQEHLRAGLPATLNQPTLDTLQFSVTEGQNIFIEWYLSCSRSWSKKFSWLHETLDIFQFSDTERQNIS